MDSECRISQDIFVFLLVWIGNLLCLTCSESTAVWKEYNTARLYILKHKEKYKNCVGALRRKKWRL